jgi:hypothetical protein
MVFHNALGWTIFPIFQGQHCRSPSPASPPFHLLLATPVIPAPSSVLAKLILLVTTPLRESPRFPRCMLRSLPWPNHLQHLPPLTPLWDSPPAPSLIIFYATMNSVLRPCSSRNSPIFHPRWTVSHASLDLPIYLASGPIALCTLR